MVLTEWHLLHRVRIAEHLCNLPADTECKGEHNISNSFIHGEALIIPKQDVVRPNLSSLLHPSDATGKGGISFLQGTVKLFLPSDGFLPAKPPVPAVFQDEVYQFGRKKSIFWKVL